MPPTILYTGTRAPSPPPGAHLIHVPMLRVELAALTETPLRGWLQASPCALVCYSRNAVRALARSGLLAEGGARARHQLWCVGEKTAALASRELPGLLIHTPPSHAQRFEGLAEAMRRAPALPGHVVALELEGKPRPLAGALVGRDLRVDAVVAYATHTADEIDWDQALGAAHEVDWIVVTSPRGARALARLRVGRARMTRARIAAIGPTTAAACHELGIPPALVPLEPNVSALLATLARGPDVID